MIFQTEAKTISAGELQEHVSRFLAAERPRRARLTDYYRGCQGVRKGPIAQGRPNNQLTANYARYITDVHTGYFLGVPPTLTFDRRRTQERMNRALEEASLDAMLYAAARDMSICGEGYLLTYLSPKGPRLARLSPLETFLITSGVRREPAAAVRVHSEQGDRVLGELYLPGRLRPWELQGKVLTFGPEEALRREKRRRLLLDEARAMLRERDISPGFAGLLLGEDSADTRRRVELFERQLSQTLQQCLDARLPAGEPRDFAAAKPQKRPRGIRRP